MRQEYKFIVLNLYLFRQDMQINTVLIFILLTFTNQQNGFQLKILPEGTSTLEETPITRGVNGVGFTWAHCPLLYNLFHESYGKN